MQPPDILVIVPTCGHFDYARRAALSLLRSSRDASDISVAYVVIDDASPDWYSIDWAKWPVSIVPHVHFDRREGLTRSWNRGLQIARQIGARYAVCTNSDVLFSRGWARPLMAAIHAGFDLIGPVTNAPGHATWQDATPFCRPASLSFGDQLEEIDGVASFLARQGIGEIEAPINGFFMMASAETWWRRTFSSDDVFDPSFPLVHNEVELQKRWTAFGRRIGFAPQSYIFHYRSVSRSEGLRGRLGRGAFRPIRPADVCIQSTGEHGPTD